MLNQDKNCSTGEPHNTNLFILVSLFGYSNIFFYAAGEFTAKIETSNLHDSSKATCPDFRREVDLSMFGTGSIDRDMRPIEQTAREGHPIVKRIRGVISLTPSPYREALAGSFVCCVLYACVLCAVWCVLCVVVWDVNCFWWDGCWVGWDGGCVLLVGVV